MSLPAESGGWPTAINAANIGPLMADLHPVCMGRMQGHEWVPLNTMKLAESMAGGRRQRRRRSNKLGRAFIFPKLGHDATTSTMNQIFPNLVEMV